MWSNNSLGKPISINSTRIYSDLTIFRIRSVSLNFVTIPSRHGTIRITIKIFKILLIVRECSVTDIDVKFSACLLLSHSYKGPWKIHESLLSNYIYRLNMNLDWVAIFGWKLAE